MNEEAEKEKIRATIDEWMRASAAGDLERVLSLMAEDVVFLLPGRPPLRGRQEFAAAQAGLGKAKIEGKPSVRDITIAGQYAFVWNYLDLTITPAGGPPVHRAGDILSVFRKEPDGRWILFRDANLLKAADQHGQDRTA